MHKFIRLAGRIVGMILALIGLGGISDNLASWAKWIKFVQPYLNHNVARWVFAGTGIGLLFGPRILTSLKRSPRETPQPTPRQQSGQPDYGKGFLDFIVDGQEATKSLGKILTKMSSDTHHYNKKITMHTRRVGVELKTSNPKSMQKYRNIASNFASDMNIFAEKMEDNLEIFKNTSDLLAESYIGYIEWVTIETESERFNLAEFQKTIQSVLETIRETSKKTSSFRNATVELRGISQDLNRASVRTTSTLDEIIHVMGKIEYTFEKILSIIDEKL